MALIYKGSCKSMTMTITSHHDIVNQSLGLLHLILIPAQFRFRMSEACRHPNHKNHSTSLTSSIPRSLRSSLVHAGLVARAVTGATESRSVSIVEDACRAGDAGAAFSIRKWLTSLRGRRPPGTSNDHRVAVVCTASCPLTNQSYMSNTLKRVRSSVDLNLA